MLVLLLTQPALTRELARDQIQITIRIAEQINVEFEDERSILEFDLTAGVSSELLFKIITNSPVTVSFESEEGFGEEINDLFEYVVKYEEEGEEKKQIFKPGGYIPTGIIAMEPGTKDWQLIIRLREDIGQQWQMLLNEGLETVNILDMDTDWTALEPGVYTDYINMTFHRLGIDQYIMERFE